MKHSQFAENKSSAKMFQKFLTFEGVLCCMRRYIPGATVFQMVHGEEATEANLPSGIGSELLLMQCTR